MNSHNRSTSHPNETGNIISVRNVTKRYRLGRKDVFALNDVSIDIRAGEIVAIVGPSGSGKSSLLQLVGGLDKPTSGTIEVNGQHLAKMSDRKLSRFRNQTIGFVFQFFYLQPFLTVQQNIEIAAMPSRTKKSIRRERIAQLTRAFGLTVQLRHRPKQLSGGQIQRVAIARAVVNRPSIILADEPTGNLDTKNSSDVMILFQALRQQLGTTIIIATHDQNIASRADRILTIKDGRLS